MSMVVKREGVIKERNHTLSHDSNKPDAALLNKIEAVGHVVDLDESHGGWLLRDARDWVTWYMINNNNNINSSKK